MSCWTERFYLMKRKKHQKDLFRSTYFWPILSNSSAILGDRVSLRYHGGTKRSMMHIKLFKEPRLPCQLANSCGKSSVKSGRFRPKMQSRAEKGFQSGSK